MERGGCEIEGPLQPVKSTAREEGQDVGGNSPDIAALFRVRHPSLSYLIYASFCKIRVHSVGIGHLRLTTLTRLHNFFFSSTCLRQLKILLRERRGGLGRSYIRCNGVALVIEGCLTTLGLSRTAF
jgi:hypothetical protein